jgi:5-formyltetrahydrofolate cyclo-ligase
MGRRALATAKRRLRARILEARKALPLEERERLAGLVEDRVVALDSFADARSVLLFSSFAEEVPTGGLIRRAAEAGKRVLLPYLDGPRLEAAPVAPGEELVPTGYGPKEPANRLPVPPEEIDLVVTPGLAFDRRGHRLGYGRGFYDRYLDRLRPDALRVGVAFAFQVVDEVPAGPGDLRVHLVVTEAETIDCRDGSGSGDDGVATL